MDAYSPQMCEALHDARVFVLSTRSELRRKSHELIQSLRHFSATRASLRPFHSFGAVHAKLKVFIWKCCQSQLGLLKAHSGWFYDSTAFSGCKENNGNVSQPMILFMHDKQLCLGKRVAESCNLDHFEFCKVSFWLLQALTTDL